MCCPQLSLGLCSSHGELRYSPHLLPHHALSLVAASAELASPPSQLLPDLHFQSSTSQQGGVLRSLWNPSHLPIVHLHSPPEALPLVQLTTPPSPCAAGLTDCSVTSRHVFGSGFNHRTLKIAPRHCSCHPVPGRRIQTKKGRKKKKRHKDYYENNPNLLSFAALNSSTY